MSVSLFFGIAVSAEEKHDEAYLAFYRHYYQLFATDSTEEFYKASALLQQNYLKKGNVLSYYKIRQNEIFYDAAHGRAYLAIKKANELLEDMKNSKTKNYELPYMSLGYIFDQRGCYRIAVHYYHEALDNINPRDSTGLAHIYSELASINITRNPAQAQHWIGRLKHVISADSLYYKSYLALKEQACFFGGEKEEFFDVKREFDAFIKRTPVLDHSGEHLQAVMENAFMGKYDEALRLLDEKEQDDDVLRRYDVRIRIYEMMGYIDKALQEADIRRNCRDSLNNDLLFNNLNEINAAVGVAKLDEKMAQDRQSRMATVILLLMVTIGWTIARYVNRQGYQKRLVKQNEQLEIALGEAKESDRMKNIFIKHVSHEIRTPLNIITGYAQVVVNPAFSMGSEERNNMVQAISRNTAAITDIVNDLLELSQEESKERYRKDDNIVVNEFCRQIMAEMEKKNEGRLELAFQSSLPDGFTLQSNQGGIERILLQLLNNALKFTEHGRVELSVYGDDDADSIHFAITDTGVGIPEELREQVFEQFYKIDSFTQGLGIGLSMSRRIAVHLGGTLAIDADYHDGTRMILTLPANL